jgi:hypothetical protein
LAAAGIFRKIGGVSREKKKIEDVKPFQVDEERASMALICKVIRMFDRVGK